MIIYSYKSEGNINWKKTVNCYKEVLYVHHKLHNYHYNINLASFTFDNWELIFSSPAPPLSIRSPPWPRIKFNEKCIRLAARPTDFLHRCRSIDIRLFVRLSFEQAKATLHLKKTNKVEDGPLFYRHHRHLHFSDRVQCACTHSIHM